MESAATAAFRAARDLLLRHRLDHAAAYEEFSWPELDHFNYATDWFDVLAAEQGGLPALTIVEEDGAARTYTFAELADLSRRTADWLAEHGVRQGDRLLLLLGNRYELWVVVLAAIRLGAVVIPATTLLTADDVAERIERGQVRHVVCDSTVSEKLPAAAEVTKIAVGDPVEGWLELADAFVRDAVPATPATPAAPAATRASDPLLLYFTSGTTAQPKLVEHTHASYPVGHLSTLYWIGLQPRDVHLNVSSPGWAKHAWSSVFAPWNAGATVLIFNFARFDATALLDVVAAYNVTTLCAPPTVWRMLVQQDLARWRDQLVLREVVSAGEPLNPEVIEQVRAAWGHTIRDGYGQTETTAQIGNPPGLTVELGAMGRPLPGYVIRLVDPATGADADEGEICVELGEARPVGLMVGYRDDPVLTADVMRDGCYHTGDLGQRDDQGLITYVGRSDDVFKASDYRISPFELESVLLEHEAVAEAAIVPSPDPVRLAVPKAYVVLAAGFSADDATAQSIFAHARSRLAPYKRIRRLEFADLPKTISGKIRRVELRAHAARLAADTPEGASPAGEFTET